MMMMIDNNNDNKMIIMMINLANKLRRPLIMGTTGTLLQFRLIISTNSISSSITVKGKVLGWKALSNKL